MNPDPDYSTSYLLIRTDADDGLEGHGFVFTIGRGNEVQVAAIRALEGHLLDRDVEALLVDLGGVWRELVHDSQLRWLGPEKGVMHMAIGAAINALWDLKAKRAGVPLWQLLSSMPPEEIVDPGGLPLPVRRPHPSRCVGGFSVEPSPAAPSAPPS